MEVGSEAYQKAVTVLKALKRTNIDLKSEICKLSDDKTQIDRALADMKANLNSVRARKGAESETSKEIQSTKEKLSDLEHEIEELNRTSQDLKSACEKTIYQLCSERKKRITAEEKLTKAIEDTKSMTEVARKLKGDDSDAEQIDSAEKRIERCKAKEAGERDEFKKKLKCLHQSLEDSKKCVSDIKAQSDGLAPLVDELEGRLERRNATISDLEGAKKELGENVEEVTAARKEAERKKNQLTKEKEVAEQEIAASKKQTLEIIRRTQKKCDKIEAIRLGLTKLQGNIPQKEAELRLSVENEFKERIEAEKKNIDDAKRELDALSLRERNIKAVISETSQKIQESRLAFEKKKAENGKFLQACEAKCKAMEDFIEEFQKN